MPWLKVDDGFHGHPKVAELSLGAVGLWTLAGSWSAQYLTDGEVKKGQLRRFGAEDEYIQELVDSGLWDDCGNGTYQFHDWEDYQPVKADVEAEREAARERMKKVRAAKKGLSTEDVQANTPRTTSERSPEPSENFADASEEVRSTPPIPSLPFPSPPVGGSGGRRKPERPLPAAWAPNSAHSSYAGDNGINLDFQAERFRNHAQANDRRARDWDAAFRNWLLKAEKSTTASKNPLWDA